MILKNEEDAKEMILNEFGGSFNEIKNNKTKLEEMMFALTSVSFLVELSSRQYELLRKAGEKLEEEILQSISELEKKGESNG